MTDQNGTDSVPYFQAYFPYSLKYLTGCNMGEIFHSLKKVCQNFKTNPLHGKWNDELHRVPPKAFFLS
jgi:hypothetical protein